MRGTLVLVVGPSGAGKDSVIDGARQALAGDSRFHFARRCITRPAEAGGEDHEAVSHETFDRWRGEGRFALFWAAHGHCYGIPRAVETHLSEGRSVVANVSRTVIELARSRYRPLLVVNVTAPAALLARRLMARARENSLSRQYRLARATSGVPIGADVVEIANDGPLEDAVARFVSLLR